jgi:hypothetical protein
VGFAIAKIISGRIEAADSRLNHQKINMTTRAETIAKTAAVFNSAVDYFDHPVLDFWDRFGQHTIDRLDLEVGDRPEVNRP